MTLQPAAQSRARSIQGALLLAGLTALWGSTFVVVKDAVDPSSPGAWPVGLFMCVRFFLAAICFIPFFLRRDGRLWIAGVELGVFLFLGYFSQIIGQKYTSVARSAFITSTYVILVPVCSTFIGRHVRLIIWICALMALAGVAFLSFDASPPNRGDLWTCATALAYSIYMLRLESHSRRFPAPALTGISLLTVACCSLPFAMAEARPNTPPPYFALLYLSLICTALVTWLQTIGQSLVSASQAAIIFTLEPCFALAFAYLIHRESLGPRGWLGASFILAAALFSQIPAFSKADQQPAKEINH
ncbi:MAG TPA: DMT family transporter [Tepidisphaeraceae bacterium]|jgi:drug/metabolite transporter (DMT)-like permease|nr:DMT family transporter [Tepidisphaeraceae bacterium]